MELAPKYVPKPEDLFESLQKVPGVAEVKWQTSKKSQGNVGNHCCEQSILVYSAIGGPSVASLAMEFV